MNLQDGNVCTCGSSFGMYGPASDCVELCEGDYSQYCGGIGAHAVFKASGQLLLFHFKLKTLLFNKSYPYSSSSPYLPPHLNSKHHPP